MRNVYGLGVGHGYDAFLRDHGEQGIAFVPFCATAGTGRQDGAGGDDAGQALAVARAHGASPAQMRVAWTPGLGRRVLAIPGTGGPGHLTANVAAGALRLSEDEMAALDGPHHRAV